MSFKVPDGWSRRPLEVLFTTNTPGFWGQEPTGSGDVQVLRATNLTKDNRLDLARPALRNFPERKLQQKALHEGDIILERSGGSPTQPVGRVGFFTGGPGYSASNFMQIMRVDQDTVSSKFCFFLMAWLYSVGATERLQKATTGIRNLDFSTYMQTEVLIPPLHEQRRIAEILSSVDEAIAATRAVIEQTRKVKQSSLGALFHQGNWTDAEPPAGHHLTRLEDIARRGSGHTPSKKFSEYWNGGVAWVSLQDTKTLDRRHINKTAASISDLGIKNSSAEVHPAGTVFVSRDATVGKVGIMQTPMAVSQHFISWTCGPMLDNLFLYYWLLNMKPVFERIAAGSTIKTIGLGFFKELQIAIPDIATQKHIASQMMAIDDSLDSNEASLAELMVLKSALMSDLLTGGKRVTDDLPMAAE